MSLRARLTASWLTEGKVRGSKGWARTTRLSRELVAMAVQSDWESKQPDTREVEGKKRSRELGEVNRRCAGCAGAGQSQRGAAPRGEAQGRGGGFRLRWSSAAAEHKQQAARSKQKKRSVGSAVRSGCRYAGTWGRLGVSPAAVYLQNRWRPVWLQFGHSRGRRSNISNGRLEPFTTLETTPSYCPTSSQAPEPSGGSPLYPQLAPRLRRVRRAGMARWFAGHVRWCNFGVVRPVFLVSSGTTLMKEQKSSPLPGLELHTLSMWLVPSLRDSGPCSD